MKLHNQLKWLHPYLEALAHIVPLDKISRINLGFYKGKRPPFVGLCTAYDDESFTILIKMPEEVKGQVPLPFWAQEEILNHLAHEFSHAVIWAHTSERFVLEALIYHQMAVTLHRLGYEQDGTKLMKECLIYALTEPDGEIRYIGQSRKGLSRARLHSTPNYLKRPQPVYSWIRELLSMNRSYGTIVIQEVPQQDLHQAEIYWIKYFKDRSARLLNVTAGGLGALGRQATIESRRKLADNMRGRKISEERKLAISKFFKGKPQSEELVEKRFTAIRTRRKETKEARAKLKTKCELCGIECPLYNAPLTKTVRFCGQICKQANNSRIKYRGRI